MVLHKKGDMNRHIASVHDETKPYKCAICDYNCSLKSYMKKHVASVHEEKNIQTTAVLQRVI